MKDHVIETKILLNPYGEDLEDYIAYLHESAEGLINPKIDSEYRWGGGGDDDRELIIRGWRPMTEKEIEKAKAKRLAALTLKKKEKADKEAAERKQLAELLKKYGNS